MRVETIADCRCEIAEVPMWHPTHERVYWIDIPAGEMYWYDPETDAYEQCFDGGVMGGYSIQEDGSFLLFMEAGAIRRLDPAAFEDGIADDSDLETVVDSLPGEADSRFNDVIADPKGRVFGGTMPTDDQLGALYRLETDGSVTTVIEDIDLPNGMGFSPDREVIYVTESNTHTIHAYDYDLETGDIDNQRVFVDVPEDEGMPDGLTVDEEGYVWSARWDGGCLVRYSPDGEEVARIHFPARKVSSVTFGGENYEQAYVTTALGEPLAAGESVADRREEEGAGAGALFRVELGVSGVPEFRSRIGLA